MCASKWSKKEAQRDVRSLMWGDNQTRTLNENSYGFSISQPNAR